MEIKRDSKGRIRVNGVLQKGKLDPEQGMASIISFLVSKEEATPTIKRGTFTVEAQDLEMFSSGVFLERKGVHAVACNTVKAEEAIKRMEAGETILLTKAGEIVSKMRLVDGTYTEMELEG